MTITRGHCVADESRSRDLFLTSIQEARDRTTACTSRDSGAAIERAAPAPPPSPITAYGAQFPPLRPNLDLRHKPAQRRDHAQRHNAASARIFRWNGFDRHRE